MRSKSSGTSRKAERRIKFFLLFLALILGVLISLESKTHFLRLQAVETSPNGLLSQSVVWKNISNAERHFWLLLPLKKDSYERQIESCYPVDCKLQIAGWGKMRVKLELLEPVIMLGWNGKYWYLSENGKIWAENLAENNMLALSKIKGKPVLFWSDDRTTPYEIGDSQGKIKKSALPVEQIMDWYQILDTVKWLDRLLAVKTENNDGMSAIRLIFKGRNGETGVSVLLPEDSDNWVVLALAVNKICPDLTSLSQNDFIDATYNGKILVKNGVQ